MRGVLANRRRTADTPNLAAQGQSVSRKTVAEVPLTGLSLIKTSRGKWSQEQVEDSGEQLLLYSHLASEISPGKKIATRFLVLTKTKEPVIEEHVREVDPGNVKRTLAGVERVWQAIESGVFYPAPSVMSCS